MFQEINLIPLGKNGPPESEFQAGQGNFFFTSLPPTFLIIIQTSHESYQYFFTVFRLTIHHIYVLRIILLATPLVLYCNHTITTIYSPLLSIIQNIILTNNYTRTGRTNHLYFALRYTNYCLKQVPLFNNPISS